MIKVFYNGYAKKLDFEDVEKVKIGMRDYRENFFNHLVNAPYSDYFYIFDLVELRRFNAIDRTTVEYLDLGHSKNPECHFALRLTDEDGNPDPFTIEKGVNGYRHENGNRLKLYFDDAPIDDVAPIEKELSESKENGYLLTIGAMLKVFADSGLNQAYLANEILKKYKGIHGLGKTSIDTKFSDANAIFNEKLKDK